MKCNWSLRNLKLDYIPGRQTLGFQARNMVRESRRRFHRPLSRMLGNYDQMVIGEYPRVYPPSSKAFYRKRRATASILTAGVLAKCFPASRLEMESSF